MKILLDTGYLPEEVRPRSSGAAYGLTRANEEFVRALLNHGSFEEYHLLVREPLSGEEQAELKRRLYSFLPAPRLVRLLSPGDLAALLGEDPPDIWHRGDPRLAKAVYLRDHLALRPFPVTGVTHALSSMDMKGTLLQLLVGGAAPWDGIACTSAAGGEAIERLAGVVRRDLGLGEVPLRCELRRIPLGVDTEVFRPANKEEVRARLGWPTERFIFTSIGRLSPHNKMELVPLLKAYGMAAASSARGRYSRLYIIGREQVGGYGAILMEMARLCGVAKQVHVVTDYDGAQIPLMHAASDCFLSPSDHVQETFGLTPIEAMACAVPAIVSDWDGYRETVVDGETGLCVPTFWADGSATAALQAAASTPAEYFFRLAQSVAVDVPALARAMSRLIEDEGFRRQLGEAGRRRVVELYSWPGAVSQYEAWWAELRERMSQDTSKAGVSRNLFTFSHFEVFGHYATRLVDDEAQVRVSDRAASIYPHVLELMDTGLCQELSKLCADWTGVGELFGKLGLAEEEREKFNFNLMALLKYDLLALKPKP